MADLALVPEAKAALRRDLEPDEALELAERLLAAEHVSFARRVLARALRRTDDVRVRRRLALATSKDLDLPATRHRDALALIDRDDELRRTTDQETLGIAGGILKRSWDLDGNVRHLERSLALYRRGHELGVEGDGGYTSINTAFLLDLLAALDAEDARAAGAEPRDDGRRAEAEAIRRELVRTLPTLGREGWWLHTTLAEAHLGLGDHDRAVESLRRAAEYDVAPWQFETAIRQLATIAQLRGDDGALALVTGFLGEAAGEAALSARVGKVGLALSGGGFRASFFHIGVLAKLAELDVLRRVEVLSCVSGGSIVGAHYYLKVRALLQRKSDDAITQDDYVMLVRQLADEFTAGVRANLRCRAGLNPVTHVRTIVHPDHTTRTVGELFERELYARVRDGEEGEPRWLTHLFIEPKGAAPGFEPKRHNWLRRAKAPMLVLNATTLNTGHNWQFTASWMGEPPAGAESPADRNDVLRRMYYEEAPESHRRIRLGHAVAASAAVPGLFNPIELRGLYGEADGEPVEMTVRLVDGGVHDNQGTASLLEQGCSVIVVSDASGQMGTQLDPATSMASVPLRASSILMARVRGAQYEDLLARLRSSILRGLVFVHLKQGLPLRTVDWTGTDDPVDGDPPESATPYGISSTIQQLLAGVRTDLDAFHDAEAYALMTDGYVLTGAEVEAALPRFPSRRADVDWPFLAVKPAMRPGGEGSEELERLLRASGERFFKLSRLAATARAGVLATGALAVLALALAFWTWRDQTLLTVGILGAIVLAFVLLSFAAKRLGKLRFRETVVRVGVESALAVLAPLAFGFALLVVNRRYLERGSIRRLSGPGTRRPSSPP